MSLLNLETTKSLNFPIRSIRDPRTRMFQQGSTKGPLIFGNVYAGKYMNPVGKKGRFKSRIRTLPLHDRKPLFIFLEYSPLNGGTVLGLNLNFSAPSAGGSIVGGDDKSSGTRETTIALVNAIKRKLNLVTNPMELDESFFIENGVDYEQFIQDELQLTPAQESSFDRIIEESMRSQRGMNWGALMGIQNKYFNVLNVMFRRYKIRRLQWESIDNFKPEEKIDLLHGTGDIQVVGGGRWTTNDVRQTINLALRFKDWEIVLRNRLHGI